MTGRGRWTRRRPNWPSHIRRIRQVLRVRKHRCLTFRKVQYVRCVRREYLLLPRNNSICSINLRHLGYKRTIYFPTFRNPRKNRPPFCNLDRTICGRQLCHLKFPELNHRDRILNLRPFRTPKARGRSGIHPPKYLRIQSYSDHILGLPQIKSAREHVLRAMRNAQKVRQLGSADRRTSTSRRRLPRRYPPRRQSPTLRFLPRVPPL
jgi:hypothetical protein